jgi:hypothetical protein
MKVRFKTLSVRQTQLLLHRAIDPLTAPRALLQLLAAHRRSEVDRQRWEHMHLGESIHVDSPRWRAVPFHPVLIPWLAPYFGLSPRGPVDPEPERSHRRLVRAARALGIELVQDVLRRTHVFYRLAATADPSLVAKEMGSCSDLVRARHWPRVCLERNLGMDADAFFGLTPAACGREGWADEVAAWFKNHRGLGRESGGHGRQCE